MSNFKKVFSFLWRVTAGGRERVHWERMRYKKIDFAIKIKVDFSCQNRDARDKV